MNNIRDVDYGIQKIEEHFSSFLISGFHLTKSKVDRKGFGNWAVVLQSKECLIKFIQDRGSVSLLVGPPWASKEPFELEHFFDLYLLIDFNNKKQSIVFPPKYDEYDVDKRLHEMSIALKENFHDLVLILNGEDVLKVEKEVKDYYLQRLRRIYPNIR
jgi:hypothetical protein